MNAVIGFATLVLAILTVLGVISGTILAWWILIWFIVGFIAVLVND